MLTPLSRCRNVDDLRRAASRRLPAPAWHYLEGGAEDEVTVGRNRAAFSEVAIMPRMLRDTAEVSTRTRLFGRDLAAPFFLSPTGMSRLFHHHAEPAVARAAAEAGVLYGLSTMATTAMEDIAALAPGAPRLFQLYVFKDRGLSEALVEAARASGYDALCLTVDTPIAGNRERDHRTGMTIPPKFGLRSLVQFAMRPEWSLRTLADPGFGLPNVERHVDGLRDGPKSLIGYVNEQFDRKLTWADVEWLRARWDGPLVIKGLLAPEDCEAAVRAGADAIVLSNHGGRQLDGAPAPFDVLGRVREAVGDEPALIVDGGVRRGSDVMKCIAGGADACSIGRPYLYGLAAGGEAGVARAIEILRGELERCMVLAGCAELSDVAGLSLDRVGDHAHPFA